MKTAAKSGQPEDRQEVFVNLQEKKKSGSAVLWTRQVAAVLDEIEKTGVYRVKKEYIEAKNDTIADYYLKLYAWYTREARNYIALPTEVNYPVWLSVDESVMLQPVEDTVIFRLEVPEKEYILCNFDAWGYVVNYWYVPTDDADAERHRAEIARYGLKSDDELILTGKGNFYPLLKRKLLDSWKRVFTMTPADDITGIVATTWEIKKEWIREVRRFDG